MLFHDQIHHEAQYVLWYFFMKFLHYEYFPKFSSSSVGKSFAKGWRLYIIHNMKYYSLVWSIEWYQWCHVIDYSSGELKRYYSYNYDFLELETVWHFTSTLTYWGMKIQTRFLCVKMSVNVWRRLSQLVSTDSGKNYSMLYWVPLPNRITTQFAKDSLHQRDIICWIVARLNMKKITVWGNTETQAWYFCINMRRAVVTPWRRWVSRADDISWLSTYMDSYKYSILLLIDWAYLFRHWWQSMW